MNIFKKIRNNKASAESAMFVFGIAIFATIVVFALDIFGLTWQRYLATRELSNISRLYAIRAYDLYYDTDVYGAQTAAKYNSVYESDLAQEMMDSMSVLVEHGQLSKAVATIYTESNFQLMKIIIRPNNDQQITVTNLDQMKNVDYGDTLYIKLDVLYRHSTFGGIANQGQDMSEYSIQSKFAFESKARTEIDVN